MALVLLSACGSEAPQLQQCRAVIEHFTPLQRIVAVEERVDETGSSWLFELELRSALGPQAGRASCHYPLDALGRIAENPDLIALGNTVFTRAGDLADLLALRKPDLTEAMAH